MTKRAKTYKILIEILVLEEGKILSNSYRIPYSKVSIDNNEINAVSECLQSGWLTTGNRSFEFERQFAKFVGSSYSLAVSSCTAALHLSLVALGIQKDDEVILSPMTFVSTANVIEYCGAKPVFVDIDSHTFNMTAKAIEKAITTRTKAIIVVHYAGHPCDMDEINRIALMHKIPIVEDAAHAIGSVYKNKIIGNSNNLVCFSFYPTKSMTTGEGGMITTNNEEFIERLKKLRLHGMSKDAWERYGNSRKWGYDIDCIGYKYNMSDIFASIGIEQLKKIENFAMKRQNIADFYDAFFKDLSDCFVVQSISKDVKHSRFMYLVSLKNKEKREDFILYLQEHGIQTSVLFTPIYHYSYYRNKCNINEDNFPVCEDFAQGLICLPIYPLLEFADLEFICQKIRDFIFL